MDEKQGLGRFGQLDSTTSQVRELISSKSFLRNSERQVGNRSNSPSGAVIGNMKNERVLAVLNALSLVLMY